MQYWKAQNSYVAELFQTRGVDLANLGDKCNSCKQNAVIAVREEVLRLCDKVICEVGNFAHYTEGTQSSLGRYLESI